jgi:nanoRNase/pAp phosphatase (c-di-AMP/oligoRNAs hydrolase)
MKMTTPMQTATQTQTTPEAGRQEVAARIKAGSRFLITSHRNPDGDALGSSLALRGILLQMGKEARVIVRDTYNRSLRHIPGAEAVEVADALPSDYPAAYDAIFTMECPEHERTGFAVLPGPVVNIWGTRCTERSITSISRLPPLER